MLAELKFVMGSVASKSLIPALSHFAIDNGRVRGYNGTLALCSPLPLDLACKPRGEPMVRAIGHCSDTATLALTPTGKLSIKAGSFRALIDCIPDEQDIPHPEPDGDVVAINGEALLQAFKACEPFIGDDASRPWNTGCLLKGRSAFATNNICLVEYWVGGDEDFPVVNIPAKCVREMVRIDEAPISAQFGVSSVTFNYTGDRWLRTQLLSTEWPDIANILARESVQQPIDPTIFMHLVKLKSFLDKYNHVYMSEGKMSTHVQHLEGACVDLPGLDFEGVYSYDHLMLLKDVATTIDWSAYPAAVMFQGERLRGAIIGMRKP